MYLPVLNSYIKPDVLYKLLAPQYLQNNRGLSTRVGCTENTGNVLLVKPIMSDCFNIVPFILLTLSGSKP